MIAQNLWDFFPPENDPIHQFRPCQGPVQDSELQWYFFPKHEGGGSVDDGQLLE